MLLDGNGMSDNKGMLRLGGYLGMKSAIRRHTTTADDTNVMNDTSAGGSKKSGKR